MSTGVNGNSHQVYDKDLKAKLVVEKNGSARGKEVRSTAVLVHLMVVLHQLLLSGLRGTLAGGGEVPNTVRISCGFRSFLWHAVFSLLVSRAGCFIYIYACDRTLVVAGCETPILPPLSSA